MTESHYEQLLKSSIKRYQTLQKQRDEIDLELLKLQQFLYATLTMVPEERKLKLQKELDEIVSNSAANKASLAQSIRRIFKDHPVMCYSVTGIKAQLDERAFDFSKYKSNPLSSISTTLRRMVETGELIAADPTDGPTMFAPPSCLCDEDEDEPPQKGRRK